MAEELPSFRYVPPVDPNIGRRFGRYIVRKLLGRGGMGAAYLAEHEAQAHVRCVIKFVLAELAQNPMVISRYKTETEAVSLLKHDNIVKLQDFGVLDDGQLFMCFEYIEGNRSIATSSSAAGAWTFARPRTSFSGCVTRSSTRMTAVWCIVISSPTTS